MSARLTHLDQEIPEMFNLVNMLLAKSWAPVFFNEVLRRLDAEPFAVLFSENQATRPSTPILVSVGAMIVQQYPDLSDERMVEACRSCVLWASDPLTSPC